MAEVWIRKYNGTTITMCYKVKVFDSIDWKFASPISPMPLPEESGEENILVKMEGNTHTLNLIWLVKNQDENAGVTNSSYTGTNAGYTENSKTIFQQLKWLSSEDGGFIGRHIEDEFDIACQTVKEGYLTIAPTTRAFGKTRTTIDQKNKQLSSCRSLLMQTLLIGRTPIGERVWDISRLIDWAINNQNIENQDNGDTVEELPW